MTLIIMDTRLHASVRLGHLLEEIFQTIRKFEQYTEKLLIQNVPKVHGQSVSWPKLTNKNIYIIYNWNNIAGIESFALSLMLIKI